MEKIKLYPKKRKKKKKADFLYVFFFFEKEDFVYIKKIEKEGFFWVDKNRVIDN